MTNRLKYEPNYIHQIITENLHVDKWHKLLPNGEKHYQITRYTYPKREERMKDGKWEIVRNEVEGTGRPYVFKRDQFIPKNDTVEVGAETKWLNQMTPAQTVRLPHYEGNGHASNEEEELPF